MRAAFSCLVAVAIVAALQSKSVSGPGDESAIKAAKQNAASALAAAKKFHETELATLQKLHDEGAVSDTRVDDCRETIAWIHYNQATLDKRSDDIRKSLREVISIREATLNNLTKMNADSLASQEMRDRAERAVAYARYRLAIVENRPEEAIRRLRFVVDSSEKTLKRLQNPSERESISEAEIDQVRANLEYYRYRLFRLEGKNDDSLKALRAHVATRARISERYDKLLERQMAGNAETYIAKANLLASRIMLAVREQKLEAVRTNLAERIKTLEELTKLYEGAGAGPDRRTTLLLKAHIAWEKCLLAGATDLKALTLLPFLDPVLEQNTRG